MCAGDLRANVARLFRGRQRHLTVLAIVLFIVIGGPQGTWDFVETRGRALDFMDAPDGAVRAEPVRPA
jgi:hypothetical protein